jgi:hypothetical protein
VRHSGKGEGSDWAGVWGKQVVDWGKGSGNKIVSLARVCLAAVWPPGLNGVWAGVWGNPVVDWAGVWGNPVVDWAEVWGNKIVSLARLWWASVWWAAVWPPGLWILLGR